MEPSAVVGVHPQVERARRMAALADRYPAIDGLPVLYSLFAVQRLFDVSKRTVILLAVLYMVWDVYDLIWVRRHLSWLRHGRSRSTPQNRLYAFERVTYFLWSCATALLSWPQLFPDPPGGAAMALLWLPTVALLFLSWRLVPRWPRMVLAAAYATGLVLLPLWIPPPARRFDILAVAQSLAFGTWKVLGHLEARALLRETGREDARDAAVEEERA